MIPVFFISIVTLPIGRQLLVFITGFLAIKPPGSAIR